MNIYYHNKTKEQLKGHNWVLFAHKLQWTITLNSNFQKPKIIFNKIKKMIWTYIVLWKKPTDFQIFYISFFCLSNQSISNSKLFWGKRCKIYGKSVFNWKSILKKQHALPTV